MHVIMLARWPGVFVAEIPAHMEISMAARAREELQLLRPDSFPTLPILALPQLCYLEWSTDKCFNPTGRVKTDSPAKDESLRLHCLPRTRPA